MKLAHGKVVTASHRGEVRMRIGKTVEKVSSVHYIPELQINLLSCSRINHKGMTTIISNGNCKLVHHKLNNMRNDKLIRKSNGGLFIAQLVLR